MNKEDHSEQILQDERLDEIGFGGLKLIQKPDEFCYGVDAVLLADFAAKLARPTFRFAVDLGTGTGIIPLILSSRTQIPRISGVEVQEGSFERAVRSCRLNGLEDRMEFILGDVKDGKETWAREWKSAADLVTMNPPYTAGNTGIPCANPAKQIARHETTADLADFIESAAWILREKGDLVMVHRPSRIVDICCLGRQQGLEVKELQFVSPERNAAPNILLVHMVKGGGREVKLLPTLAVHEENGDFTPQLLACYRSSASTEYDR